MVGSLSRHSLTAFVPQADASYLRLQKDLSFGEPAGKARPYRRPERDIREMYVVISVHHPRPGREGPLVDSMHRYGEAAKTQKGLVGVYALKDDKTGELYGLAIWE